ncbi:MAG: hypothetical protein J7518_11170 [Nocardioidaceae bacterium]|nr:hypothetical protein [Nocardioidaceae bacterium]
MQWKRSFSVLGNGRTRRVASVTSAAAIAAMLVLGSGAAYGDDGGSAAGSAGAGSLGAPADATPADPPASDAPADPPKTDAPADPPKTDAPAEEPKSDPPAEEPQADPPADEPTSDEPAAEPKTSAAGSTGTATRTLAKLVAAPIINALTINCINGAGTVVGGFEIDGDTCVDVPGNKDWDNTGQSVVDGLGDSTTFHGGTSEGDDPAGWALGGPSPNGKTDIETAWAWSQAANGTVYGYFGISNASDTGGTSQYDVEYNQADPIGGMPNRTPGDLLFRFSSIGSAPIAFTDAKIWRLQSSPDWGAGCQPITATAGWCTIPIPPMAFEQQRNSEGTFFEGSINIGLFFGNGTCSGDFGVVNIRSVTGNSFYSSSLKDYVTPIGVDTPSTCGKIIINKKDEHGTPLAGATFSVSPNPDPTKANNVPYSITDNDAKDQNPADGVIEISPVDPNESYTVTETAAPTGYLLDNPLGTSTNPQLVGPSGTITFNFVDHKQWKPLTISKTATPSFHASYAWSVVKEIAAGPNGPWFADTSNGDPLVKNVPDDAANAGNLYYRVTVTEGAQTTSDYLVFGTIHVGNPNDASVDASVGDSLPGGTCSIGGFATPHTFSVPAGGADYPYSCDLGDSPAPADITGTHKNTATVTWDKSTYPQTVDDLSDNGTFSEAAQADYAFTTPTSTVDKTVTVSDNRTDALDGTQYTWTAQGTEHHSDVYSTTHTVTAGSCTDVIDNTVSVTGDGDQVVASDSAFGKICLGSNLSIERVDAETLVRTYPWSVRKSTSTPKVYVKDGKAVADYTVTVTAGDGVDSAWNITGTITVKNPNDWEAVDVTTLPVSYTGGGTCAVTGESFPVSIAASGQHDFHYSCNFVSQPDYNGTINATVNWDAAAAHTPDSSASDGKAITEADWGKTLVNDTVVVHDDNGTPGDTSDDRNTPLTWADVFAENNHEHVITYSVDITDLPEIGTCANRVNTVEVIGDENTILDADENSENNSATVQICNPYTQISVTKVDFETGEPLAGAVFELFQGDTKLGEATSGDDGVAIFDNKLLPGTYTVTETQAPDGYDLPPVGQRSTIVTVDHILDPDSNFVENGVMASAFTFRDPATGTLTLSKQHYERDPLTNDWVVSDGAVDFGEEIRYVMTVKATGPRLFHDTTLTDYVPGFNPADTKSTADGVLEAGSAICTGDFTCTATEDVASGLITWVLHTEGQDDGVVRGDATGTMEFIVRMPDLPADPPFVNGVYENLLWNQAFLDWKQVTVPTEVQQPPSLARMALEAIDLPTEPGHLDSEEVTDEAKAFEPAPPVVEPPGAPSGTPLPNTGGPDLRILLAGLALALGGMALVLSDRRHRRRS